MPNPLAEISHAHFHALCPLFANLDEAMAVLHSVGLHLNIFAGPGEAEWSEVSG